MLGVLGKKIGMTQVFDENGILTPVTVVRVEPNVVVGQRKKDKHGYDAVIMGSIPLKKKRLKKPYAGQFPKGIEPVKYLFELKNFEIQNKIGDTVGVEIFEGIRFVDVKGITKGKGYQGVMKRHGFRGGKKSHGSKFHRAGGSTGQAASPSKVVKGTKMAGRMGSTQKTVQNLRIIRIDKEKGVLLLKGSLPGTPNSVLIINRAKKK